MTPPLSEESVKGLVEALEFYASMENNVQVLGEGFDSNGEHCNYCSIDQGDIAREALSKYRGEKG